MYMYFAETFCVAHQSKDVILQTSRAVVPLFCIASSHNSLSYRWDDLHGDVGLLSPVYYAHKSGIYRCTVDDGFGNKCYSKTIEVTDGTLILDLVFYVPVHDCIVNYLQHHLSLHWPLMSYYLLTLAQRRIPITRFMLIRRVTILLDQL